MSLQIQFQTMLVMVASGHLMGIVFDSYRVLSSQFKWKRWLFPFFDVSYWAISAIFVFWVLYQNNQGEVRIYVFLGIVLGLWLYYLWLSAWTIRTVKKLIRWTIQLIDWLIRLFDLLIIRPLIGLYKLLWAICGFFTVFAIFLLKVVVQLCYPLWVVLKWSFSPIAKQTWWKRLVSKIQAWLKVLRQWLKRKQ